MSDWFGSEQNKSIVIREPSESVNSFGIFKDGRFAGGGYIKDYQVPHSDEEFLNFIRRYNIETKGNMILFNCDGELFGILTDKKIMSPSQVRKFVLKQGGGKDWCIKDYLKETKDWSDPVFGGR